MGLVTPPALQLPLAPRTHPEWPPSLAPPPSPHYSAPPRLIPFRACSLSLRLGARSLPRAAPLLDPGRAPLGQDSIIPLPPAGQPPQLRDRCLCLQRSPLQPSAASGPSRPPACGPARPPASPPSPRSAPLHCPASHDFLPYAQLSTPGPPLPPVPVTPTQVPPLPPLPPSFYPLCSPVRPLTLTHPRRGIPPPT